ncbi:transposase, partial [Marichromatium bheemlicum]
WRWVGRVRGRDRVCPKTHWGSCKTWFKRGTQTPRALGTGAWVRSNRLEAHFVLVKQPPRGRRRKRRKNAKRADCDASRSAREPWLLAASPRLETLGAKQIVRLYRQRMQIEEGFRDMKSLHFGQGLERCHSQGIGRFTVLVLIASLSAFLLWLIGTAAIDLKLDRTLCPGARRRRAYSRLFLARLLLTLDGYRQHLGAVFDTMTSIDQWVATEHMALFDDSGCRG